MPGWMWIIAGPNGAGKSTFTHELLKQPAFAGLKKLNADELTAKLRARAPAAAITDLNLRAAQQIDAEVAHCIAGGVSFLVETVLSSDKYRDDVLAAKAAGFNVGLVYLSLHPPELSPLRVSERVLKGGHTVVPSKAIERYHRSHKQLAWFAARADALMIYDNSASDGAPILIASRDGPDAALVHHEPGLNPAVDDVVTRLGPRRGRR